MKNKETKFVLHYRCGCSWTIIVGYKASKGEINAQKRSAARNLCSKCEAIAIAKGAGVSLLHGRIKSLTINASSVNIHINGEVQAK